jgi:drug/metabolite transporter (DMT)-like permease
VSRRKADLALAFNTLVWGATFTLVKSALRDVSPLLFLALRFSLATAALAGLWLLGWRGSKTEPRSLGGGILTGIVLFSGFLLQTLGLRLTTPAKSAFLTGLSSVLVPLLAALVYRSKPQARELLGVLVATGGMSVMTLEGPISSIGRGDLLTLLCAVAFAAHIVVLGHFSGKTSFEMLSVTQIATSAVLAITLFWWVEPPHVVWRAAVIYAILVTGLLATALAFTIQAWAQKFTSSTRTALIYTLEPVFAWLISYWALGEGLTGRGAAGAALILSGVVLVEVKPMQPGLHP